MKLLSLGSFKNNSADSSSHSWPWPPYCQQPRTLSFRYGGTGGGVSSVSKLEPSEPRRRRPAEVEEDDSGLSTLDDDVAIETAVTAALSERRRIFFKPDENSSILARGDMTESGTHAPFIEESVSVSLNSRDPYMDFRRSMWEMAAAHSLKGKSDRLEELLRWYLRANDKANHGYIFAAYVDLLVTVQAPGAECSAAADVPPVPCNNLTGSPSSPLSFYTSSTSNSCCFSSTSCHVSAAESTEESCSSSRD